MEETISSKILHKGKHFSFKLDQVKLDNGTEIERQTVDHPGAVAIVAVHEGDIVLIKQYRYATKSEILEIPAGTLEAGEDPYACAVRELQEETGYAASDWKKLLSAYVAPGYSNEMIHIYSAEGLTEIGSSPEEDESITVEKYPFERVLEMIESNKIMDAKTVTGVLAFLTTF